MERIEHKTIQVPICKSWDKEKIATLLESHDTPLGYVRFYAGSRRLVIILAYCPDCRSNVLLTSDPETGNPQVGHVWWEDA